MIQNALLNKKEKREEIGECLEVFLMILKMDLGEF
jgi:hypothetical protein